MRKVIHKLFWVWDFEKEEKWLNDMAVKGLALVSTGFCRYEFEECVPGEYKICLQFLKGRNIENEKYIEFVEETGAEHIGTFKRWAYFRKKTEDENFNLFSDNSSHIKYLTRVIGFIAFMLMLNLYMGCYNIYLYFMFDNFISLLGILNLVLGAFGIIGLIRLLRKRKKMKKDQQIFE